MYHLNVLSNINGRYFMSQAYRHNSKRKGASHFALDILKQFIVNVNSVTGKE